MTLVIFITFSIALLTPQWKRVSPTAKSLYVDDIDALIRSEAVNYYESFYREAPINYGLFLRCNQIDNADSTFLTDLFSLIWSNNERCSKNFLPTYNNDQFNQCHSLSSYRSCVITKSKSKESKEYPDASLSGCHCQYPLYAAAAHWTGFLTLIFLFLMIIITIIIIILLKTDRLLFSLSLDTLRVLCGSISVLFHVITVVIVSKHLDYETVEYFMAIVKHYKSNQIYKLSKDADIVIRQLSSRIRIEAGYSMILVWITLILLVINLIYFIFISCQYQSGTSSKTKNSSSSDVSEKFPSNDDRTQPRKVSANPPVEATVLLIHSKSQEEFPSNDDRRQLLHAETTTIARPSTTTQSDFFHSDGRARPPHVSPRPSAATTGGLSDSIDPDFEITVTLLPPEERFTSEV